MSDPGIDALLGRVFDDRYRLESLIGRGGMGAVYRATQITMNKVVAVKVVKPEFAANTEAAKRFHREAKAASSLSHPHTIRVFDFGQTPQRELYMAMEFLDGQSLGKLLRDGERVPLQRTLKIVAEIASSLVEAHERGLVHRDLKPENVILLNLANDPDFVKVLDFGIAKFLSGSSGDSTVTRTGAVIGTPQYMAPEQARASRSLSTAADVYSLGVIFYEMATGAPPFEGDSPIDMLMAHVTQPVPELPADLEVPDDVRHLVTRMLAKKPEARPSAADVAREVEEIREREKALMFLARAGAAGRLAAGVEEGAATTRLRRSMHEPESDETAIVNVVPSAAPSPFDDGRESVELDLPRRSGSKALLVAGGLVLLIVAIGLAVWQTRTNPPDPVAVVPQASEQAQMPRDMPKPASPKASAPSLSVEVPAVEPRATAEEPAPPSTAPIEAPKPVEAAAPVAVPEPPLVKPKPVELKPKPPTASPKPIEPKPEPAAPKPKPASESKPPDRTPAVW